MSRRRRYPRRRLADEEIDWTEDPGWHLDWRAMVPYVQLRYFGRGGEESLTILRSAYISFPISLFLFCLVLLGILPLGINKVSVLWALGIGVLALVLYVVEPRLEPPLACASDRTLAGGFRSRVFLRIGFANSAALCGFTAAFITNSSFVYFVGLLVSIPALLRAAPTRAALAREQAELTARGCQRSLVAALRHPRPE